MIWPAPGVAASTFADAIGRAYDLSNPVLVGVTGAEQVINRYLSWVNDAARMMDPVLRRADLDRLLFTPRYWATLANPIPTAPVLGAVQQEAQDRLEAIKAARRAAAELRDRWVVDAHGTHICVPDTGVLLNHKVDNALAEIITIDWRALVPARTYEEVRVVVPILVVDELELIKDKRKDDVGKQARRAVNQLFDWFQCTPDQRQTLTTSSIDSGRVTIELLPDERGHTRLPRNDDELVDRAVALRDLQSASVHFLSYDSGAVLRANLAGIKGQRLRDQTVS